jgi:hypothetical protein
VERRGFFLLAASAMLAAAEGTAQTVRGKLHTGPKPLLTLADGATVPLQGDAPTMQVLADGRLNGMDLEVSGRRDGSGPIQVGPIHTRAMKVLRAGKALMITYWCEVCSIRTYAPGICVCCQDETALDLRESL